MSYEQMSTSELFDTLQALVEGEHPEVLETPAGNEIQNLLRDLHVREIELEIQNRELREAHKQLALDIERRMQERTAQMIESHQLLRTVMDEALDIIYVKDLEGRYLLINSAGANFIGRPTTEIIGTPDTDLMPAETIRQIRENERRIIESGSILTTEFQLTSQWDKRWFQTTAGPYHDHNGEIVGVVGIARDITERRQREDAQRFLNEASAVLTASLDFETTLSSLVRVSIPHLADCCVVDMVEEDHTIHRAAVAHGNPEKEGLVWKLGHYPVDAHAMFGRGKVVRTGRPELYADITDVFLQVLSVDPGHLALLRKLDFRSYMCVPLNIRGQTIGSVSFMLDRPGRQYGVSDLALAEDLAYRAAIALDNATLYFKEQEANRLKDEFLAMVSHELRTPLMPILGSLYKLRLMRPDDTELNKSVDMIERNTRAQARIVEDLLDMSRITTGKLELQRRPTDLANVVASAVEIVRPATEALGIRLDISVEKLRSTIWCDPDRIQQVVWNLLSNSIKFTPRSGCIEVTVRESGNRARIQVRDNGAGIRPEFLPHVFERFRQGDTFSTRTHAGLGLGLSIVRYIADRHGGNVWAESPGEGLGSTFTVDLPLS